jgi:hypothetical protein
MTTHDQQTATGPYDESQTQPVSPAARTPQVNEQTAPVDSSTASTRPAGAQSPAPPRVEQEHRRGPSVAADKSSAEREPSTTDALFADDELAGLRARWAGVQAGFVDDPKECVQKADVLVSDLVDQLTTGFAHARSRLEEQWARGEEASTEDLRLALMHYREFFERLLAV